MPSIKDLFKSLALSLGDPKKPAQLVLGDLWKAILPPQDTEEMFLNALYQAVRDEAGVADVPWTKDELRKVLRYEIDLGQVQLADLGETEFSQKLVAAFEGVALIPSRTKTEFDFEQIARNVVKRALAGFVDVVSTEANVSVFRKMLAQHASTQGLKVQELYGLIGDGFPQLETRLTVVDGRLEAISSMTGDILEKIAELQFEMTQLQRTIQGLAPEQAVTLGLSRAEVRSLESQLRNYQENLRMIQEHASMYVSPIEVPLQYKKDIALIQRKINEIRGRLGVDAKS